MKESTPNIHLLGASSTLAREVSTFLVENGLHVNNYARSFNPGYIRLESYEDATEKIKLNDIALIFFAVTSPRACQMDKDFSFEVNVRQTGLVIKKIHSQGGRVIFMSSDAVYGLTQSPADENSVLRPVGAYGQQKAIIEEKWFGQEGFIAIRSSLNVSNNNLIIRKIMSDKSFSVLPGMYRNILLTSDLAQLIHQLILTPSGRWPSAINAGGPDLLSVAEFFSGLSQSQGQGRIAILDWDDLDRECKPSVTQIDSTRACSVLGRSFLPASAISLR